MTDIKIIKLNETFMKVVCKETFMELDISDRFSFMIPNARYDPLVKAGKWDGIKKLYNRKTKRLYIGLLLDLLELCNKREWSVDIDKQLYPKDELLEDEDIQELTELINPHDENEPIALYDDQFDAVKYMLNNDRTICLAATSAGKSLIIYHLARIYQLLDEFVDKKIFICVPNTLLVEQLYSDFKNYSTFKNSNWNVSTYCQKISAKYSKHIDSQIVITTWQSMCKLPAWIYDDIGAVIVDEVHTASAGVLSGIIESCSKTTIKHGLTGTLDGTECNEMFIKGLFGETKKVVTARELIDKGRGTDLEIRMSVLSYPEEYKKELIDIKSNTEFKKRYNAELEYLYDCEIRKNFLLNMIQAMPGNSLVLFDRVDKYGKKLYEEYKAKYNPNSFLIIGEVDSTERERIRQSIEDYENATIFATFQTMQAGVSIKKLHNLFIVSSSKSKIRILQSIGRLMRLHVSKQKARIFDIVDDLRYDGKNNYSWNHAKERISFYTAEQHKIEYDQYKLQ